MEDYAEIPEPEIAATLAAVAFADEYLGSRVRLRASSKASGK